MKKSLQRGSVLVALLFTACVPDMSTGLGSNLNNDNSQQAVLFKTNQVRFMNSLKDSSNLQERNAYLDEFLLKSDIQCQNYLNNPLKKPEVDTSKDSLYMGIFDTVSGLFGMSLATNAAKAVFLDGEGESMEEKKAYANALSAEIRKGVEIGRTRYAKGMSKKKTLDLKAYSINNLREDMLKYDKQCDDAYGLIEINRALKEMQSAVHRPASVATPTLSINPKAIKAKVEAASKEVEKKKIEKKIEEKIQTETNTSKVSATEPKQQNVPVRHDNVQQMPRSIQL